MDAPTSHPPWRGLLLASHQSPWAVGKDEGRDFTNRYEPVLLMTSPGKLDIQGESDLLTLVETAQYLRLSRHTLYKMAASGRIPAMKAGRQWRFSKRALGEWMLHHAKIEGRAADKR